jgi:hypothetical protein
VGQQKKKEEEETFKKSLRIKLKKKNEGDKTDYTIIRLSYNSWC